MGKVMTDRVLLSVLEIAVRWSDMDANKHVNKRSMTCGWPTMRRCTSVSRRSRASASVRSAVVSSGARGAMAALSGNVRSFVGKGQALIYLPGHARAIARAAIAGGADRIPIHPRAKRGGI